MQWHGRRTLQVPDDAAANILPLGALRDDVREDAGLCSSGRTGGRTRTSLTGHGILSHDENPEIPEKQADSDPGAAHAQHSLQKSPSHAPELHSVIDAWPNLSVLDRAAILAIIQGGESNVG